MKSLGRGKDALAAYLFLAPAILGLIFYTFIPIFGVVQISLTNWDGLKPAAYVGLQNFREIFTEDMFFPPSVISTLYFALFTVVIGTIYAFVMAMLLNQRIGGRGLFRSLFFLPYIVPTIGAAIVWAWMFESNFGVINYGLNLVGLNKVKWLGDELTATPALGIITIWGFGNFIVIYLAHLQGIPRTYLEAVEIDGGTAWHKFPPRHPPAALPGDPLQRPDEHPSRTCSVFVPALFPSRGEARTAPRCTWSTTSSATGFMNNRFGYASRGVADLLRVHRPGDGADLPPRRGSGCSSRGSER